MEKKKKKAKRTEKPLDRTKAKQFTCIVCPRCCVLETDGVEVNGARCPKGEGFALQEMVMPLRVVTTTVRVETSEGTRMIPVKTSVPVPMARIFETMKEIKAIRLSGIPAMGAKIMAGPLESAIEWVVTGEVD
jgi:CxxC motif-containing protein